MKSAYEDIPDYVLEEVERLRTDLTDETNGIPGCKPKHSVGRGMAMMVLSGNVVIVFPRGATWVTCSPSDAVRTACGMISSAIAATTNDEEKLALVKLIGETLEEMLPEGSKIEGIKH